MVTIDIEAKLQGSSDSQAVLIRRINATATLHGMAGSGAGRPRNPTPQSPPERK